MFKNLKLFLNIRPTHPPTISLPFAGLGLWLISLPGLGTRPWRSTQPTLAVIWIQPHPRYIIFYHLFSNIDKQFDQEQFKANSVKIFLFFLVPLSTVILFILVSLFLKTFSDHFFQKNILGTSLKLQICSDHHNWL